MHIAIVSYTVRGITYNNTIMPLYYILHDQSYYELVRRYKNTTSFTKSTNWLKNSNDMHVAGKCLTKDAGALTLWSWVMS